MHSEFHSVSNAYPLQQLNCSEGQNQMKVRFENTDPRVAVASAGMSDLSLSVLQVMHL